MAYHFKSGTVYKDFDAYPVYTASDLGVSYAKEKTVFKLWSPNVAKAMVLLYDSDELDAKPIAVEEMESINHVWTSVFSGDIAGYYYTFQVTYHDGSQSQEATDPYARGAGTNGHRAQVIDLEATNPVGWGADEKPALEHKKDIIIYELHIRDLSIHESSGIEQKGKFLGLTEKGTKSPDGLSTGLDHLLELGVTHVHLLPVFDFMSVDESRLDEAQFNWGYDPANYNVPEGSYSSNPSDGHVRIKEFKQLIQTLHAHGIRVIMDVVYNHTGRTENSNFEQLIPGYFYRFRKDGSYSDASGCGNEIASERPMVRKFMLESLAYWVKEYHIDGFRFDLMGIHDIETMNEISKRLHEIDNSIFLYGEGWAAAESPLPAKWRALKANTPALDRIAAFSDDIRDAIKGNVFAHAEKGFVSGQTGLSTSIRYGIAGATRHPQIDYAEVNYSDAPWANGPWQCINYASCHDNHTLWDRLEISCPDIDESTRERMHRLALAIVLTSQGVVFMHAGSEMLRTKAGEENSYKSPDSINAIDWSRKAKYKTTYEYIRKLIAMRKRHPAFRLRTTKEIQQHLHFIDTNDELLIAYELKDVANDDWQHILIAYNGSGDPKQLSLPVGLWLKVVDDTEVCEKGIGSALGNTTTLMPHSMLILIAL